MRHNPSEHFLRTALLSLFVLSILILKIYAMKSTKGKQSKGWRRGRILRHALERMTAPSAEGAKGDFASAEAGFRACGHDQRTELVWRLCARPLETFAPCGGDSLKVAAALSAAVTTTYLQEIAPNLQAEPSLKSPRPPNASRSSGERGLPQNLLIGLCCSQRWQVAAALSAAVTTAYSQENVPNSQAEPST